MAAFRSWLLSLSAFMAVNSASCRALMRRKSSSVGDLLSAMGSFDSGFPARCLSDCPSGREAMACSLPVIITQACGIRSLVEGRAGLVIAPEKKALVEAIRKLLDDRSLYARLKSGCREIAAELSWDRLTVQMERCYSEVLGNVAAAR